MNSPTGFSMRPWLDRLNGPRFKARELRVICTIVLCITPIALVVVVAGRDLSLTAGFQGLGGDFPQFFMAGWLLNHYPPSALYDLTLQSRLPLEVRTVDRGVMLPFLYPPFLAMVFRPFALLTYPWAYATWSAISLSLYVAGLLVMFRLAGLISRADRKTMLLLALAFEPFLVETLAGGQLSSIGFLCLALAIYLEQRGRPFLSGVLLSLCLYKPTILALFLAMLLLSRRWRILGGFGAGSVLLVTVTALVMGPSVWADYVSITAHFGRLYVGSANVLRGWKYIDLRGATSFLTGEYAMGLLALGIAALLALPLLIRTWWTRGDAGTTYPVRTWALTIVWTLLLNAYVPVYDGILVVLAFILMAHALAGSSNARHQPALQWLTLLTFVTAWISPVVARVSGVQALTCVLVILAVFVGSVRDDEHGRSAGS